VTDLDGTFLGDDGVLLDNNLEAVEYFKKNGGFFTFATGRMHKNMLDAIPYPEKIVNAPSIMANGTYIFDWANGTAYEERFIPQTELSALLDFVRDSFPQIGIRLSCAEAIITDRFSDYIRIDLESAYKRGDVKILSFNEMKNMKNCYKAVFRGESDLLDTMRVAIYEKGLLSGISDSKSFPDFYEIQAEGCDKARGVFVLRQALEREHGKFTVYACGDYENDEAMLKAADIAVCPSNATDRIKQISHLCLCKNTEGLIAELIRVIEKQKN